MSLAILADHMASKGRGPDSMLIHMSPREVQGLQALAENHGGSLTINPETGLPEAGFLDKLLPAIIGFGVSYLSGGTIDPKTAAMIVGGVETARTGDIGKGISAGLGAYGGANLGAGMTTTGSSAMANEAGALAGSEAAAYGTDLGAIYPSSFTPEAIDVLKRQAIDEGAMQQGMSEITGKTTTGQLLSKGFDVASRDPMGYLKANAKNLMYAAGPAILAGANVQSKGPQTVTKPGMIRPYSYFGGQYVAGNPYEAAPTRSAEGGLMGLAGGGMTNYDDAGMALGGMGGMFDFAQRSEPVVRMARGGVAHFEEGGGVSYDYGLGGGGDSNYSVREDGSIDYFANQLAPDVFAPVVAAPVVAAPVAAAPVAAAPVAAAPVADNALSAGAKYAAANKVDIGANVNKFIQDNPFATATDINTALTKAGLTQADVNPFLTANTNISDATRYALSHASEMPGAGGLAGMQANIMKAFATPGLTQTQIDNEQKKYGISNADIQSPLAHGYQVADTDTAKATNYLRSNPDVQAWLNSAEGKDYIKKHPEFDANDIAYTHYKRYGEKEGRKWEAPTAVTTVVGGTGNDVVTPPPFTSVTPTGYYGSGPATGVDYLGRTVSIATPGDIVRNLDGTSTVVPNIPGREPGGFTGMDQVKSKYTAGGGSLGIRPFFVPKTLAEMEERYPLRGGSKQAFETLMGRTKYSPVPYTEDGQISKSYAESVMKLPRASSDKMYIFKDGKFVSNPDYAIPTRDKEGVLSRNVTNQDVINYVKSPEYSNDDAFLSWMTLNNLTPDQIATAAGISVADVYKKIKKAKPVDKPADVVTEQQNDGGGGGDGGQAAGGLMKMAQGGMSNLGDYSDGGRLLRGPGDGVSDSIPATIGNKRPARLADGEFVVPARIVSELGNGSTEAGARKLYAMMDRIQSARRGTVGKGRVAKNSRSDKYLPA